MGLFKVICVNNNPIPGTVRNAGFLLNVGEPYTVCAVTKADNGEFFVYHLEGVKCPKGLGFHPVRFVPETAENLAAFKSTQSSQPSSLPQNN